MEKNEIGQFKVDVSVGSSREIHRHVRVTVPITLTPAAVEAIGAPLAEKVAGVVIGVRDDAAAIAEQVAMELASSRSAEDCCREIAERIRNMKIRTPTSWSLDSEAPSDESGKP